jgi:hypothetical protein
MPVGKRPAAVSEAAIGVFFGIAWRLDDAIQRDELVNNDFSHDFS